MKKEVTLQEFVEITEKNSLEQANVISEILLSLRVLCHAINEADIGVSESMASFFETRAAAGTGVTWVSEMLASASRGDGDQPPPDAPNQERIRVAVDNTKRD